MDRRDGLDGKPGFFVLLTSVLFTPQALMTSPAWIKEHGGAAAILPYVICVLALGIPLVFLELSLGQFMQRSGTRLWAVAPLFKGLAISSMLASLVRSSVNTMMASWAGFYIYLTLTDQIPSCNTSLMHPTGQRGQGLNMSSPVHNKPSWSFNLSTDDFDRIVHRKNNETDLKKMSHQSFPWIQQSSNQSQQHYTSNDVTWDYTKCDLAFIDLWRNDILDTTSSITSPGQSVLQLFIGSTAIILVCIFISVFGVAVMRKIMMFLLPVIMTIPVAILTQAFLGDTNAITTRLASVWTPDFELLTNPNTWLTCCHQILLIHGLSVGVLPSLSSYLKWNNNTFSDAVVTCVLAALVNVMSCLLVFAVTLPGTTQDSPTQFLFTTLPLSLSLLPHPYLWIVLFFFFLIVVIVTTNVIYWEVTVLAITDASKNLSKWRVLIVMGVASFVFLLTIPMSLQNGVYIFRLMEFAFFGPFLIGILCLFQSLVMAFVYGGHKFYDNLETMTGYRPHWWMRFSWAWVCPGLVLVSLCYHSYLVYYDPILLGVSEPFPDLSNMLMVVITCLMLLPVPLAAVWVLCSGPVGCIKKLRWSVHPRLHPYQIPIRWRLERKWHKFSPL